MILPNQTLKHLWQIGTVPEDTTSANAELFSNEFNAFLENDIEIADAIRHVTADSENTILDSGTHLNLTGTGALKKNGYPTAGFFSDGTPYYITPPGSVAVTINDGSNQGTTAHGIADADSNDRIFGVSYRHQPGAGEHEIVIGESASTVNYGIWLIEWTDSIIRFYRNGTTGNLTLKVNIWFV